MSPHLNSSRGALLFSALLLPFSGFATNYFVGPDAINQPGIALSSVEELNAYSLQPGDRVLLQGGQTFPGTLYLGSDDAGTPTAPVVITSFGTGRATIAGGANSALTIYNSSGFEISHLNLVGSGSATNMCNGLEAGVYLPTDTRLPYLRFDQMEISGFSRGVLIWAYYSGTTRAWPGFSDVKLNALDVHHNRSNGIETWGTTRSNGDGTKFSHSNFVLSHCEVSENRGDPASQQHTGSGIIVGGVDNVLIEYCVAHDIGGIGPISGGGAFGIWTWV